MFELDKLDYDWSLMEVYHPEWGFGNPSNDRWLEFKAKQYNKDFILDKHSSRIAFALWDSLESNNQYIEALCDLNNLNKYCRLIPIPTQVLSDDECYSIQVKNSSRYYKDKDIVWLLNGIIMGETPKGH